MHIHYLQHIEFEKPGFISDWFRERGITVSSTQLCAGEKLPSTNSIDGLIVLGGPMGVHDEDKIEWLKAEKEFINQIIEKKKPILGICLGAQLIAEMLGAKVYPHVLREVGWFPLTSTKEDERFAFTDGLEVLHWHGDTYDLPEGAVHLAKSKACEQQAFLFRQHVLGLQFHLEVTPENLNKMIEMDADFIREAEFVQSAAQISNVAPEIFTRNKKVLFSWLDLLFCMR